MFIDFNEYCSSLHALVADTPELGDGLKDALLPKLELAATDDAAVIGNKKALKDVNDARKNAQAASKALLDKVNGKLGSLTSGSNRNIARVRPADLPAFLSYLINISFYPQYPDLIWDVRQYLDPSLAAKAMLNGLFQKKQAGQLLNVSTHNVKMINTAFESVQFLSEVTIDKPGLVCSASVDRVKSLDYIGGAPDAKYGQLISTEFELDGQMTSMFQALKGDCPAVIDALKQIQPAAGTWIDAMMDKLAQDLAASKPAPGLQMLIPCSEEDYVAITPIVSIGMSRSFHDTLFAFKEVHPDRFLLRDQLIVGGTQPINAGKFNVSLSGRNQVLNAQLPQFKTTPKEEWVKRYRSTKTFVNVKRLENCDLLKMPLTYGRQVKGFKRYLPLLLVRALVDLRTVSALYQDGALEGIEPHRLNEAEVNLIKGCLEDDHAFIRAARYFTNVLVSQLDDATRAILGTDNRMAHIQEAMVGVIKEIQGTRV